MMILLNLWFLIMVPEERLELSCLSAHDFESCVYTNFTTRAKYKIQDNKNFFNCQKVDFLL